MKFPSFYSLFSLCYFVFLWHWSLLQPSSACLCLLTSKVQSKFVYSECIYGEWAKTSMNAHVSIFRFIFPGILHVPEESSPNINLAKWGEKDVGLNFKLINHSYGLHYGTPCSRHWTSLFYFFQEKKSPSIFWQYEKLYIGTKKGN